MRKNLILTSLVVLAMAFATVPLHADEYYEVNTSPDARRKDYRQGEVIVKFKDDSQVSVKRSANGRFKSAGVSTVDNLLRQIGVEEMEPLMPLYGTLSVNTPRKIRSHNGTEVEVRDMSRLYCLKFNAEDTQGVEEIVEQLNALPEVEFAEPNYLVYINSLSAPNDPLYPEQWGIPAVHADELWEEPLITDKRPVVAILDTGVDIAHPDLQANIWTNPVESTGSGGYDDDSNGFTDDVCGWDFVNQTGIIQDYNGHGTHCAGISAAVGDNGIGICGANPDALIMPVTVMQSDGTGDVATIIKGIDYAAANGADVISMSFGGYAYSIAEEQALARAYAKAVLVAAAGNDGHDMDGHHCMGDAPMFPAAFTFVLGVQASNQQGGLAGFSNWDCNGPVYSSFGEEQLYNYELTAPGTNIMSTYPGGRYKALNGTSMACPLVAGAVSRLLSAKEYQTKELLFGDLIHSAGENVNFKACYDITDADRKPNVSLVSWRIEDEKDNDGRFDAGETIKFYPTIRNEWGTAQNIVAWLELGELEGKVVEITHAMADFDKPLSSYAKAESADPIVFRLKDDVADGRHIRLVFYAQCAGMEDPSRQEFVITAENCVEIGGLINVDTTLEPGLNYKITRPIMITKNVTLTILPGTRIQIEKGMSVNLANETSKLICVGEPDNMIYIESDCFDYNSMPEFVGYASRGLGDCCDIGYVYFKNIDIYSTHGKNCIFENNSLGSISKNEFSNFIDCYNINNGFSWAGSECSNFVNTPCIFGFTKNLGTSNYINSIVPGSGTNFGYGIEPGETVSAYSPLYCGTGKETFIRKMIPDYNSGNGFVLFDYSSMGTQPSPKTHGVLWKVVVDGYDAQDEFEMLPPLGVGLHKFEVWYNRLIDEKEIPNICMGVRPPYTQTAINENGSWRTELTNYNINCLNLPKSRYDFNNSQFGFKDVFLTVKTNAPQQRYEWDQDLPIYVMYDEDDNRKAYPIKIFKEFNNLVPNGRYRLKIKVSVNEISSEKGNQFIYFNDFKEYLSTPELTEYELTTEVLNNRIEVGFVQTDDSASIIGIGQDCELILEELYPTIIPTPVSVYTAYLDIKGGMDIDGLNRIYVSGCKDLENFDIPIENTRFNVEVAAAGSMSTGFMAEPGLGKVTLTWDNQDENVDDILGYNLYRYQVKQRTENVYDLNPETGNYEWFDRVVEYNDTIRVNQRLLDETQFVDYDVVPGTNYNYYYKIMRTNMAENSPSRVVSVTPLTASKGDANGSMSVDVADVVTEVSYITGGNPQPFIFEAADVNDDEEINVLDIVGTVRIILNPGVTSNSMNDEGVLKYWIDDNVLWIDNDIALGGVQFNLDGVDSYTVLDDLSGFETVSSRRDDSLLVMSYSMTGRTIAPGRHALLNLEGKRPEVMNAVASDAEGHNVVTMQGDMTGMMTPVGAAQMRVPTPNPFTDAVTIPFAVGEGGNHEVRIVFSDLTGNTVGMHRGVYEYGEHAYTWRPALEGGIYLATLYLDGTKVQTAKLVKK